MSLTSSQYAEPLKAEYTADELNNLTPGNEDGVAADAKIPSVTNQVEKNINDKFGRLVLLLIKLRPCKFNSSSYMTHCNDLRPMLQAQMKDGKTGIFIP